ncbi:hypothetical protein [Methylobacterium dankookense]|uniref:Uncharacterized protein n=1 Tax=Methylobacterium dankookense TaxID=560405 RepID=A0A564FZT6_9HYPH|nr:hypothetical protein [Methylobacterium dankookense]GJD57330.1 hypothetical protein IFDJLNFL_3231 [Methylobacterium dankookense]VUF13238.1 hypothetical protein MTDSW087_02937 [Methylobacterium dankookense]
MVALEETDDLVVLRYLAPAEPGDETAYLDALERVGARPAPFALILVLGGVGKLSAASERAQALWFKRTRADLDRRCRGLVIVRPGFEEAGADVFRRLWAFPIRIAADEAAARAAVREHFA